MIRAVLFDAGDVLYSRATSSTDHARRLLAARGHTASLGVADAAALDDLRRTASLGRLGPREYWSAFLAKHGVTAEERPAILDEIDRFADDVAPGPQARETLLALRQRGLVLAVVTDTMYPLERKMRWLERVGVADLLDAVSCSTVLGTRKPDPAIYLDALHRIDMRPEHAAFVGHDTGELAGASAIGMATVAVHPDAGDVADVTIAALPQLLDIALLQRS